MQLPELLEELRHFGNEDRLGRRRQELIDRAVCWMDSQRHLLMEIGNHCLSGRPNLATRITDACCNANALWDSNEVARDRAMAEFKDQQRLAKNAYQRRNPS